MDVELKCNILTCRKSLNDKAVVTTCSHIFCVECANKLFTAAKLCPACETSLSEPDDVVVCSLHPSNDYKTSVLSGLNPSIILEICSRAISFWQYQTHQESSYQSAVVRNLTDKAAQLQKQLDNVVREANGEITLLNNKTAELEKDLQVERRKVRELQESSRERDKEYQRLKTQLDKLKRKTLLPGAVPLDNQMAQSTLRRSFTSLGNSTMNIDAVVGGMEANGIQRTSLNARDNQTAGTAWLQQAQGPVFQPRPKQHRHAFTTQVDRSSNMSERSVDSSTEADNLMAMNAHHRVRDLMVNNGQPNPAQWTMQKQRPAFAPQAQLPPGSTRRQGGFRPAHKIVR